MENLNYLWDVHLPLQKIEKRHKILINIKNNYFNVIYMCLKFNIYLFGYYLGFV